MSETKEVCEKCGTEKVSVLMPKDFSTVLKCPQCEVEIKTVEGQRIVVPR